MCDAMTHDIETKPWNLRVVTTNSSNIWKWAQTFWHVPSRHLSVPVHECTSAYCRCKPELSRGSSPDLISADDLRHSASPASPGILIAIFDKHHRSFIRMSNANLRWKKHRLSLRFIPGSEKTAKVNSSTDGKWATDDWHETTHIPQTIRLSRRSYYLWPVCLH